MAKPLTANKLRGRVRENLMTYAVLMDKEYEPNWHHEIIAEELMRALEQAKNGEKTRIILTVPPRHGKQIAHSTPILTTEGWKTHGEIERGDFVFGPDGEPVEVLAVSDKEGLDDHLVKFSDGSEILSHANHEWVVWDRASGYKRNKRIIESKELLNEDLSCEGEPGERGHRRRFFVDERVPVKFPRNSNLKVHPYLLGVWLGDGRKGHSEFCGAEPDISKIVEKVKNVTDFEVTSKWQHADTGVKTFCFSGLWPSLRVMGVPKDEKLIPEKYMMASEGQRLTLLAGLIDSDGHMGDEERYRFSTTSRRLAEDVRDLVLSLGDNAYIMTQEPHTSEKYGIIGKKKVYQVGFNLEFGLLTALERKRNSWGKTTRRRSIVGVEKVSDPKLGRCIQVDGGIYLVGKKFVPTHNSYLSSIIFPTWALGQYPEIPIIVASYSGELATDFGMKARDFMQREEYKQNFSTRLRKDVKSKSKWMTKAGGGYTAVGVGGSVTGRGFRVGIIDDPFKNRAEAESERIRKKVWDWYRSVFYTRQDGTGAIVLITTRWHQDDLAGKLLRAAEEGGEQWHEIKFPAIATHKEEFRDKGEALWPYRFSKKNLEGMRDTLGQYNWSCTPGETPILMADWTYKPIKDVEEGDFVVGHRMGTPNNRARLYRAKVKNTFKKEVDDVYKLTTESGREVFCTKDHRWHTGRKAGSDHPTRKQYNTPKVGRRLMYVGNKKEIEMNDDLLDELNYLAGIIDGDGSIADNTLVISQTRGKNTPILERIMRALDKIGFEYNKREKSHDKENWSDKCDLQVRDASLLYRILLRYTDMGKKGQIVERMFKRSHMPIKKKDKVVDIEFEKKCPVYALETETGNYIAWGHISSNSLYQQTPIASEAQEFKEEYFRYISEEELERINTRNFITIDTAVSQKEAADYCGIVRNSVDHEGNWYIKAWRGRYTPSDLINLIFTLSERDNPNLIGIEDTAHVKVLRPFLEREMSRRGRFPPVQGVKHAQRSKEGRIRGLRPLYRSGQVFHVKGSCEDLEEELLNFPKGVHDDVLDAMAYQLDIATKPPKRMTMSKEDKEFYKRMKAKKRKGLEGESGGDYNFRMTR